MAETNLIYDIGTVAVTNGSATWTGTGTLWNTPSGNPRLKAGDTILATGGSDKTPYKIKSVNSDTSITTERMYQGSTASGLAYQAYKDSVVNRSNTALLMEQVRSAIEAIAAITASVVITANTNAVNKISLADAVTGGVPEIAAIGSDTNVSLRYSTQGAGEHIWEVNGADEMRLSASALYPHANDGLSLGKSGNAFSDVFLAAGAVININAGDVTITHSTNALAFAGASSGYSFDASLFLPAAAVLNFNAGNYTLTHAAGQLTAAGGPFIAPSFVVTGSTVPTNGIYLSASNTVALATNSTQRISVDGSGTLHIVANTPSSGTTSGSLVNAGGFGNAGNAFIGGALNVSGSASFGGPSLSMVYSDDTADGKPQLLLRRISASPDINDILGVLLFQGRSDAGVDRNYAYIRTLILSPTNASENGRLDFLVAAAGSTTPRLSIGAGLFHVSATGGDKGNNTINFGAVYDDSTLLTCFGVEHLKYGQIDLTKWDGYAPGGRHDLAHAFVEIIKDFDPRDHRSYIAKMFRDEALPGLPSQADWAHNAISMGEMTDRLWLSQELQAGSLVSISNEIDALTAELAAAKGRIAELESRILH